MNWIDSALIVHVLTGFTALGTGVFSLLVRKGGSSHKTAGKIFYYCMIAVAFTAILISSAKGNAFLLLIAFFGLYQNLVGVQSLQNKGMKPTWKEWLFTLIGCITGIIMVSTGNIVLIVFGAISLSLVLGDLRVYRLALTGKPLPKLIWLGRHIGNMMGAFIATVTAFVVVNVRHIEPAWIPWLAPTAILVPLMYYFQWKYVRKNSPLH